MIPKMSQSVLAQCKSLCDVLLSFACGNLTELICQSLTNYIYKVVRFQKAIRNYNSKIQKINYRKL